MSTSLNNSSLTTVTGSQLDGQFAGQLIGKDIPLFIGGQALMGCRIIEGPFIRTAGGVGFCDMIVSCAQAATPQAARTIKSINLNGTQSWTAAGGFIGSAFAGMEVNFLYGSETQLPLASSISRFGSRAVPYRSQICAELKNVPLSVFANTIPFVSLFVHESDFLARSDALAKLAAFCRFRPDEYEFSVSGADTFWIAIQQSTFIQFLQYLQKTIGRNWNIQLSDKLRVFENGSGVSPIEITRSDVVFDSIKFIKTDPLALPAVRTLGFIDIGRDNDFNTAKATRARFPIALTASEASESYDLPIGMAAIDAASAVNKSLLIDDIARDKFQCKVLPSLRGLESGDIIFPNVASDIPFSAARIISVARNSADWTADIIAEQIELSLLAEAPRITSDGGADTAIVDVSEGITFVTTVTAAGAPATGAFSIAGGIDAAFFTINADTGVLSLVDPPVFTDPLDDGADNTYQVIVKATGNGLFDTQTITVDVEEVVDVPHPVAGSSIGLLLALTLSDRGSPAGLLLSLTKA